MSPMPRHAFAIVCDSACDLPLANLEAAGVALVPLVVRMGGRELRDCLDLSPVDFFVELSSTRGQVTSYAADPAAYRKVYEALVLQGNTEIVSLHASSSVRDSYASALDAARAVSGARVHVVDTACLSGQMALVLARLVLDRDAGLPLDECVGRAMEVAQATRLLMVPASGAGAALAAAGDARRRLRSRAETFRVRALGTRRCFTLDDAGRARGLYRDADLTKLAGNMARTMSEYAREVGSLTYVEINAGVPRQLTVLEKPLDTNEFESERAAILNTNPSTTSLVGVGAVGLAYVPASLLGAREAAGVLRHLS